MNVSSIKSHTWYIKQSPPLVEAEESAQGAQYSTEDSPTTIKGARDEPQRSAFKGSDRKQSYVDKLLMKSELKASLQTSPEIHGGSHDKDTTETTVDSKPQT